MRQALAPDGTWMIVEPFAADDVESNLNPVGRIYYCASTVICVPASRYRRKARSDWERRRVKQSSARW